MIKTLCIQVHPDRIAGFDLSAVRAVCEELARDTGLVARFAVTEGRDNGAYANLNFASLDLSALWRRLELNLFQHPRFGEPLRRASMVYCEGEHGWDDYRLLHHFDAAQELNKIG